MGSLATLAHRVVPDMKVLRLTNSNDVLEGATTNRPRLLAEKLEAHFGEPVEMVVKTPWPNERMPDIVEKWVEREQPDVVWLSLVNYWISYPSVPLRLRRLLGPPGDWLARLGFRAAESQVIGPTRPFRVLRNALLRTVGGDYHFEPEEIAERVEATARRILRREGVTLVIWGPHGRASWAVTGRQRRRALERQARLVAAIQRLAADLHIAYHASAAPVHLTGETPEFAADKFHFSERYGVESAEEQFEMLRQAIEAERGATAKRPR
jgi:hypothetical protein